MILICPKGSEVKTWDGGEDKDVIIPLESVVLTHRSWGGLSPYAKTLRRWSHFTQVSPRYALDVLRLGQKSKVQLSNSTLNSVLTTSGSLRVVTAPGSSLAPR